ncbi:MAG: hypothetical protein LBF41_07685, partial [Deltaproteobacteria bacterium]|nr:hypothetical protein [Deltaproteobacteria bacterium]
MADDIREKTVPQISRKKLAPFPKNTRNGSRGLAAALCRRRLERIIRLSPGFFEDAADEKFLKNGRVSENYGTGFSGKSSGDPLRKDGTLCRADPERFERICRGVLTSKFRDDFLIFERIME